MRFVSLCAGLLTICLFLSTAAFPCHVAANLRFADDLTPAQKSLMSHGGIKPEPIPYKLERATVCDGGTADIFACQNVDLLANMPLSALGGGSGNDLWGWTDSMTGKEYALFGRSTGTAFVDISDPENPVYLGNLPTHSVASTWRDIKVYADHAYIVADWAENHGMQIFDLTQLRTVMSPPQTFTETAHYPNFERSHNIVIDTDAGFAYGVGGNTCSGGLHMIDLSTPTAPTFLGCWADDDYTHDAQCVTYHGPDTMYQGRQLCFAANEDTVTIVDVTDKTNPTQLARQGYSGTGYTHQGWLTDDHRYFVLDDEVDELTFGHNTKTYLWDLADLDAPVITDTFLADGASIDHNQYVLDGFSYQANYQRGLRILDTHGGTLSEVGYFDTYPEGDAIEFSGAWSTFPFFASGIVLVSDINRGLFILRANLPTPGELFGDGFETGDTTMWTVTMP